MTHTQVYVANEATALRARSQIMHMTQVSQNVADSKLLSSASLHMLFLYSPCILRPYVQPEENLKLNVVVR